MIYRGHVLEALEREREGFSRFERGWRDELSRRARELRALGAMSVAEVARAVEAKASPGAIPSNEVEQAGALAVEFSERWRSHEEARRWATQALAGRVTFAADGSQALPGREVSLPVAGVQVASFENAHVAGEGSYRKEAAFEVVMPDELLGGEGVGAGSPEAVVSYRRFRLEAKTVGDFLKRKEGWQGRGERLPVAFFDGTLLISYARPRNKIQDRYVDTILELVNLSRTTRVPVVGYIDQSYARDFVNLLDALAGREAHRSSIYDAQLLRAAPNSNEPPLLNSWGTRTAFCYCERAGLTEDFRDERGQPLVGFVYLQTTGDGYPARLDIPAWVYEENLLDELVEAVRAECVVGNGYPYPLETADAAAVITGQDRAQFLQLVQEFAEAAGLSLRVSRKALSKAHRR